MKFRNPFRDPKGTVPSVAVAAAAVRAATAEAQKSWPSPSYPLITRNVSDWSGFETGHADYSKPYRNHPYVFRAISAIANAAGSVDFKLARKDSQGKVTEITNGIEYDTLQRPSSYVSSDMLFSQIAGWLQMACGECFIRIIREGQARQLVFLNPGYVEVRVQDGAFVYEYHNPKLEIILESDIIHIKGAFNPYDPMRGIGPLQAAAMAYQDDLDLRKYNRTTVRSGGAPMGFLDISKAGSWPTKEQQEALNDELKKRQQQHQKIVLVPGEWQQAGQTPEEMAFLELRKLSFKEIGGVFGVAPQLLGDFERDQADAMVQMLSFHIDTMRSIYRTISDTFTLNLWKLRGVSSLLDRDMFLYADDSKVPAIAELTQRMRATDIADVQEGLLTRNEVRAARGLDPLAGGDVATVPFGIVPLESVRALDLSSPPADEDEDEDEDEGKAIRLVDADDRLEARSFKLLSIPFEHQMIRTLNAIWDDLEKEIIARIGAKDFALVGENGNGNRIVGALETLADESIRDPFDIQEVAREIANRTSPILRNAQLSGGTRGLKLARQQSTRFKVNAKPAIEQLARQTQRFAVPVSETTWKRLVDSLSDGLRRGEPDAKLVSRVQQVMGVRRAQAQNTASTEVNAALNGGTFLGYQQSGVVEEHRWLRGGANSRPDHKQAHGQVVKVGTPFIVGGEALMYPGDPNGSAAQVCNCRCATVPARIRA